MVRELIGWLLSTAVAVPPAPLQYRAKSGKHQQIQGMICKSSLEGQLSLSKQATEELPLVDTKCLAVQWQVLNYSTSATDNKFRCINPGFGRIMLWANNWRTMVSGRQEIPHKCAGI